MSERTTSEIKPELDVALIARDRARSAVRQAESKLTRSKPKPAQIAAAHEAEVAATAAYNVLMDEFIAADQRQAEAAHAQYNATHSAEDTARVADAMAAKDARNLAALANPDATRNSPPPAWASGEFGAIYPSFGE